MSWASSSSRAFGFASASASPHKQNGRARTAQLRRERERDRERCEGAPSSSPSLSLSGTAPPHCTTAAHSLLFLVFSPLSTPVPHRTLGFRPSLRGRQVPYRTAAVSQLEVLHPPTLDLGLAPSPSPDQSFVCAGRPTYLPYLPFFLAAPQLSFLPLDSPTFLSPFPIHLLPALYQKLTLSCPTTPN